MIPRDDDEFIEEEILDLPPVSRRRMTLVHPDKLRNLESEAAEAKAELKLLRERVGELRGMLQKCLTHLGAEVQVMETRHPDLIPEGGLVEEILADEIRAVLSPKAKLETRSEEECCD